MIKLIFKNLFYMYLLQVIRLLFPLVLMPVLTKSLSQVNFGIYLYTISCALWLSMIVDYGFNISATRRLSVFDTPQDMKPIVVQTQSAKIVIILLSMSFLVFGFFYLNVFDSNPLWLLLSWLLGVMMGLAPVYYFQAINDLKFASFIEVATGLVLLALVLVFVKNDDDFLLLALFMLLSRLLSWQIIERSVMKKLHIRYMDFFDFSKVMETFKDGWAVFLLLGAVSFYTSFNVILVGIICGPVVVGAYAAGDRIIRTGLMFISQASAIVFPKVVALHGRDKNAMQRLRRLSLLSFGILGIGQMFFLWMTSSYIIPFLFSNKFPEAEHILNIMAISLPAIAIANVLSYQYFMVDKKEKILNRVIFCAAFFSLLFGYPAVKYYGAVGMAYVWIFVEWCILAALTFILLKTGSEKLSELVG